MQYDLLALTVAQPKSVERCRRAKSHIRPSCQACALIRQTVSVLRVSDLLR